MVACKVHTDCPFKEGECKFDQYIRQSERARADIQTWPTWMQRNAGIKDGEFRFMGLNAKQLEEAISYARLWGWKPHDS